MGRFKQYLTRAAAIPLAALIAAAPLKAQEADSTSQYEARVGFPSAQPTQVWSPPQEKEYQTTQDPHDASSEHDYHEIQIKGVGSLGTESQSYFHPNGDFVEDYTTSGFGLGAQLAGAKDFFGGDATVFAGQNFRDAGEVKYSGQDFQADLRGGLRIIILDTPVQVGPTFNYSRHKEAVNALRSSISQETGYGAHLLVGNKQWGDYHIAINATRESQSIENPNVPGLEQNYDHGFKLHVESSFPLSDKVQGGGYAYVSIRKVDGEGLGFDPNRNLQGGSAYLQISPFDDTFVEVEVSYDTLDRLDVSETKWGIQGKIGYRF